MIEVDVLQYPYFFDFFTVVQHELTVYSDYKITTQMSFSSYIILHKGSSL